MSKVATPKVAETGTERRARLGRESVSPKAAPKVKAERVVSVPALATTRTSADRIAFAKAVVSTREPKSGPKVAWAEVATARPVIAAAKKAGVTLPITGSVLRRAYYVGGGKRRSDR